MEDIPEPSARHHSHTVRPRWTWAGLVLMLAGLVLIAIGVVALSWTWAVVGLVVGAVGFGCSVYGGLFYDVQSHLSLRAEVRDVAAGTQFQAPDPMDKRSESEVEKDVRRRWLRDR